MLSRGYSAGIAGVEGYLITVEADVRLGLPGLTVIGQASGPVGETRERVRSAIAHLGIDLRPRRQIVNLAPADRRKDSPGLDLAVACALLGSHGVIPPEALAGVMLWGELSLDGSVRPASGTLVVADCAQAQGFRGLLVAMESADEAALIPGLPVLPVRNLGDVVAHLRDDEALQPHKPEGSRAAAAEPLADLADVRGQSAGRLAIEVMAAGGHNLLLHGPPGVGKTMLARRAGALLPDLDDAPALEVTKIHSVASRRIPDGLQRRPPVRMPHHTVSVPGLFGGGTPVRPGEVSLAHRGLLFLDELLEFPRSCLEGLREPLEEGSVTIVRAAGAVLFPARFQLLAAMNPCPCGYLGHPDRECVDPVAAVQRYQHRLSGPMLDRLDLLVPLSPSTPGALVDAPAGESSHAVRERVAAARKRQADRLKGTRATCNAEIQPLGDALERFAPLAPDARAMLRKLAHTRCLSPRAQHRLRRVALTIADLQRPGADPASEITAEDVAEAAHLRSPPARE